MEAIITLITMLGNSVIAEAVVIAILGIIVFKLVMNELFNYRTKLLAALDETQQLHVKELKDMYGEKEEEKEECVQMLKEVRSELATVKREIGSLTLFVKRYGCNNAPDCENRSPAEYDFCEGCSEDECGDCPFLNATSL